MAAAAGDDSDALYVLHNTWLYGAGMTEIGRYSDATKAMIAADVWVSTVATTQMRDVDGDPRARLWRSLVVTKSSATDAPARIKNQSSSRMAWTFTREGVPEVRTY